MVRQFTDRRCTLRRGVGEIEMVQVELVNYVLLESRISIKKNYKENCIQKLSIDKHQNVLEFLNQAI